MPITHRTHRSHFLILGCLTVLFATPLMGQVQVDYTDGQTNASNYNVSGAGSTLTLSIVTGTATQSGTLSGSGSLLKADAGTIVLSSSNDYTGGTTLNAGTIQVADGGSISHISSGITIGAQFGNTATLLINSGSVTNASGILGNATGASGVVMVSGGTWTNAGNLTAGNLGTGVLSITSGTVSNTGGFLGNNVDSNGTATVSGTGSRWTNSNDVNVGVSGSGTLNVLNGGVVTSNNGLVGTNNGSVGTVLVDGAGSAWTMTGDLLVDTGGTGALTIANGGSVSDKAGLIATASSELGTVTVDGTGSNWTNSNDVVVGGDGPGVLTIQNGGEVDVNSTNQLVTLAQNIGSSGTLNLGNGGLTGTLKAAEVHGGDGTAVVNFNHTDSLTFDPKLTGSLTVNQIGSGTTTLTAASTYTGSTNVLGGTLALGFGAFSSNILPTTTDLTLGSGTLHLSNFTGTISIAGGGNLNLTPSVNQTVDSPTPDFQSDSVVIVVGGGGGNSSDVGTQTVNSFSTAFQSGGSIVLDKDKTLDLGTLNVMGRFSAVNFNTAAGGANGAYTGSSVIILSGQSAGVAIDSGFTVTDATGFGLATVDDNDQIIRLTTTELLPANRADDSTDYRIDNNAGDNTAAGSALLLVTAPESANSITVDTTAAPGVLSLASGVVLGSDVWNFGSNGYSGNLILGSGGGSHTFEITGSSSGAGLSTSHDGVPLQINNYNAAPITFTAPILDGPNGSLSVLFKGTGTTILAGTNTYTGNTTVTGGVLEVAATGSIDYAGTTIVGSQTGDNAVLNINGGEVQGSSGVLGDSTGATGTVNVTNGGNWSVSSGLTIGGFGTGVLNLTDFSDISVGNGRGTVKLGSQGTLNLGTGAGMGYLDAQTVTGSTGAVVNFNYNDLNKLPKLFTTFTGDLAVNKLGGGTLSFFSPNTYTGRTTVDGGTLRLLFGMTSANILSSSSALTLGGGTLELRGVGNQTLNGLTTTAGTGSQIVTDIGDSLTLGALTSAGRGSALNFDTSAGGSDGASVGKNFIVLSGQTAGSAINPGFTVTDSTGFGLATVNGDDQIIRMTGTDLLPPSGADSGTDYLIDNSDSKSLTPGSASLEITASQTAGSITVDTTAMPGLLTLDSRAVLSSDVWNFGGINGNSYAITSSDSSAGIRAATSGGTLEINNYSDSTVTISAPILDNGGSGLRVAGTGTTILAGTDTYLGPTVINSGTLFINGDHTAALGTVTVQSAATLSGIGSLSGNISVQNGGILAPGNFLGLGTLNGITATFATNSIFHVQGENSFMTSLHLSGAVTIAPGALLYIDTYSALTQRSYTLMTATSGLNGSTPFSLPDNDSLPSGYKLLYTGTALELDAIPTAAYWTGKVDNKWSSLSSGNTNWATAADGLTDTSVLPDSPTDVTFAAQSGPLYIVVNTYLDINLTINSLTINTPTIINGTQLILGLGAPPPSTHTLTVNTTTTVNSLLDISNGATLIDNGTLTIGTEGNLSGNGAVQMASDQSIIVNGAITGPTSNIIFPDAQALSLTTSGTGAIVMEAGSTLHLNLNTGAGLGDNTGISSAAGVLNLHGTLNATAGGTLVLENFNAMTGFAGGDQWKVINLNNGAGIITGHLALNDSSLGLASGFVGTFDQSTGIYSIADHRAEVATQTSGLPMSNAEGQSTISGVQTATGDVNNHLFNLRSGGGEESSDGSIASSMDEGVVVGQGDGPEDPIARRIKRTRQWEVFTTVNYGNVRLNPISNQAGVQLDSWASSVGIERHLSRGLTLGFALTFLQSTQTYTGGLGSLHLEGPTLSTYMAYVRTNFWSSLLYSFGDYDLGSQRNPGLGLTGAMGSTHSYTNAVQFNTGWNFRFQNNTFVTGPFAGIDYLHGTVDAYSETTGGAAALHYNKQTFESLVTRVGWSASKKLETNWASITPQLRLSYERQNVRNNGTSVNLINAPFSTVGGNQSPGQDYMVIGTGVNFQFSPDFNMLLGYQTQIFRNNLSAHFGSVRFGYKF